MKQLLILSTLLYTVLCYVSYENYQIYKVYADTAEKIESFSLIEKQIPNLDIWGEDKRHRYIEVMVSPADDQKFKNLLANNEIENEVFVENVQTLIDETTSTTTPTTRNSAFNFTSYHNYEVIYEWLDSLVELYPEYLTGFTTGQSYKGVDIKGVKLVLNASATRVAILEGGMHAREWISPATVLYILNSFLTTTDERVKAAAESMIWYFVPTFNPDGYNRTFNEDRLHRKNVQEVEGYDCSMYTGGNGIGTDLNRNFGFLWLTAGASDNPCSSAFAGTAPFSAPETQATKALVEEVVDNLHLYLSIHSFSQLLLFPYGHTEDPLDNYYEQYAIGKMATDALQAYNGTEYIVGNAAEAIYVTTGTSDDWVKGTYGTRLVYCYELRDTGTYGFLLPPEQIIPTGEETLASVVVLVEQLFRLDLLSTTSPSSQDISTLHPMLLILLFTYISVILLRN